MIEDSNSNTNGLTLRLIKEFDNIFMECAYEEASADVVSDTLSLTLVYASWLSVEKT